MELLLKEKLIAIDESFSINQKNILEEAITKMGGLVVERGAGAEYFVAEKVIEDFGSCLSVTPAWINMLQKHMRWVEPRSFSPQCEKIMNGFRVWVMDNVGKIDKAIIYACVEHLGGTACFEKEANLSHCVTDVDEPILGALMAQGVKVVVPEYFGDCFRLGMLCPSKQYLFPDFEVRNCDLNDLISNTMPKYQKPELLVPDAGLFVGKVFYIDTVLYRDPKPLWLENIETLGGKLVERLESANSVVTETRGELFARAFSLNLQIGTKRWIRDQIKTNKLSSPLSAVLHYPYPLIHIEEMKACVISVTNYVGDPREDIASMARRMGAKFTRNLSKHNTHIICGGYISFPTCLNEMVNKMAVKNLNHIQFNAGANNNVASASKTEIYPKLIWKEELIDYATTSKNLDAGFPENPSIDDSKNERRTSLKELPVGFCAIKCVSGNDVANNLKRKMPDGSLVSDANTPYSGRMNAAFTGLRLLPEELVVFEFLNIRITENIVGAAILIAEKLSRTEKLLLAISYCVPIVSSSWKDRVVKDKMIIPWEDYLLCDPEGEKALDFSLARSIKTSMVKNIFEGITFFCTKSVLPTKITVSRLVEANGGVFGGEITQRNIQRIKKELEDSSENVICFSTSDDRQLITRLERKCYNTEWLLNSILRQELHNFEDYLLPLE